jgi:XXXCH domain-containing protein
MKKKIEKEITPDEMAANLERIADQLRDGEIEVEGRRWSVPGMLDAKIKHEEKKGRFTSKIKIRWSSLADYDAAAKDDVIQWETSFKSLKKRMGGQFKTMQKDVDSGRYPANKTLVDFVRDSLEMARTADPEWQDLMTEYLDHLENLQRAVENQQMEVVRHELRDLRNRMKQCHREYK